MKKGLVAVLVGLCLFGQPLYVQAQSEPQEIIEISYEDAQELMQIASAEALNQGEDGMLMVMSVVMNRVSSSEYPNTIHGVIHQSHQFYTKGMKSAEITPEVHLALARLEMGNLYPEIVAFERKDNNALAVYYSEAFTYGDHTFYTCKH